MRRSLRWVLPAVLLLTTSTCPLFAATPAHFWSQRFGSGSGDDGLDVTTDLAGNIYLTGDFSGTVDFGGGNLVSAGGSDVFVAKYNPDGVHLWSQRFGGTSNETGMGVAVDGSGNVFLTGFFAGTANFGGANLISVGGDDIFVAKYNSSGTHQWSQRYGAANPDIATAVAVDGSGNVLITGYFNGTVSFGTGNLVSAGAADIYIAKFNTSGTGQWSLRFGAAGGEVGWDIAGDAAGNVYFTGYFFLTVNFGGANLVSAGQEDIVLAKYNSSGVHQWSQHFGNTGVDVGYALAVDASGSPVITGRFAATVDFGGGGLVSAGGNDIFLARYNTAGVHQWSRGFGSSSFESGYGVAYAATGDVLVTGNFSGTTDFGGGGVVANNAGVFLARYDAGGVHQWSQGFGGASSETSNSVAVDGSGHAIITGVFHLGANFGGGSLFSAGSSDIFLARYGAAAASEPLITSVVDIGNDQGHRVRISFTRSGLDLEGPALPAVQYEAFRRVDPLPPAQLARVPSPSALAQDWDFVGAAPAHREAAYEIVVETLADSTITEGMHFSVFFIRAASANPGLFYDSPIDSGYSLDNLAPGVPGSFAYNAGLLSWNESSAADFDFFSIYGSNTSAFGSATLVDYITATGLDVTSAGYVYYFVTATDFSGNEGKPAVINTLSGAGGTPRSYILSVSAYPNPFNPRTTIRYTLPSKGRVILEMFDARGSRVATLIDEEKSAGAYTVEWDGRDANGNPVGSGVYFGRLSSPAGSRSHKMTLVK